MVFRLRPSSSPTIRATFAGLVTVTGAGVPFGWFMSGDAVIVTAVTPAGTRSAAGRPGIHATSESTRT